MNQENISRSEKTKKPKKVKRRILICVVAVVLVAAVIALVNFYPLLSMSPTGTGAVEGTGILSARNNMNSIYLIPSGSGYIAIDAGTSMDKAEKALKELSVDPGAIKHVLLTHSDYDHVGSIPLFTGAQLFMSEDEMQMVNGTTKRNASSFNSLPGNTDPGAIKLLHDNQELSLDGVSITCIKSPGHTPGSMSYFVDGKYLFTGDAIRVNGDLMQIHPFTMDEQEAEKSIELLRTAKEDSTLLFTAHYGYYDSGKVQ
jgi:glyoxylase-like metal-dependent hydrolase (beta-lactamase superfamily II)